MFGDLDYWASGLIGREAAGAFKESTSTWSASFTRVGFYLQGTFRFAGSGFRGTPVREGNRRYRELVTPGATCGSAGVPP